MAKSKPGKITPSKKRLTNEQLINKMIRDMHPLELIILRERIQEISGITRRHIKRKPADFDGPIFHHTHWLAVCDKIDKHLNATDNG